MTNAWQHDPAELVAALQRAHADGQGVWNLSIFRPEDAPERLRLALEGDPVAAMEIDVVQQAIEQINAVVRRQDGPLCALCETRFWRDNPPRAMAILRPEGVHPSGGVMVNAICRACWRDHPDRASLMDALTDLYREKMILDLRVLPPMAPPGHA